MHLRRTRVSRTYDYGHVQSSTHTTAPCRHTAPERPLFGGYWLPSCVACAYTYQLYRWYGDMRATRTAGHDPFKATAIWPAAAATLFYLTALYAGKRIMAQRQPFDCKKQMLVYNVYQVCAAHVCNGCVACNKVDL